MTRPSNDEYYAQMVQLVASRGTCARRKVGCILVDARKRVLSTGFNGVAPGQEHCIDNPCAAATAPSGTDLSSCRASHAEQAALLMCPDVMKINTAYVTNSPCNDCTKLFLLTSCRRIVFLERYAQSLGEQWWIEDDRQWIHFNGA